MRARSSVAIALVAAVTSTTCAKRVPEPTNVAPGTPHVTWVLMCGDRDNADNEFACQSDPRTEAADHAHALIALE